MKLALIATTLAIVACHPASPSTPGGLPQGDAASVFAAHEQASSFTYATLLSCMDGLDDAKKGVQASAPLHVKAWYCVCMADALGISKTPAVSVDKAASVCGRFALTTTRKTPTTKRTPYSGKSFLNASQIADAQKGCKVKLGQVPKTQTLDDAQKETFCSCVVDSMRARRTTSTNIPLEHTRTCADAANFNW